MGTIAAQSVGASSWHSWRSVSKSNSANTRLTVQVPPFTDNKGNRYVINKLMTTQVSLVHDSDGGRSASRTAWRPHASGADTERPQPRSG